MAKTKKQIIEDLKLVDIIIEVLDSRIPVSSQNPDVQEYAKDKKIIYLLNKSDLAEDAETEKWKKYFESKNENSIIVNSNDIKSFSSILDEVKKMHTEIIEKYISKGRKGRATRVMIVGIPNVGKSTIINNLSKKSSAKVGNKPGVTKQKQWIKIDKDIELMDTPGMLWPKISNNQSGINIAFINSIGENAIDKEEISFYLLKFLCENYKERVEKRYDIIIENNLSNEELINVKKKIAIKIGALLSGNNINDQKVSNMILNDFRNGNFGKITLEKLD